MNGIGNNDNGYQQPIYRTPNLKNVASLANIASHLFKEAPSM